MQPVQRVLWWLIAGSKGGKNRARIIILLKENPSNANQIAESLKMDYKTVRHHLKVLEENRIIVSSGNKYGTPYFLTDIMLKNYALFEEIWDKIGKRKKKKVEKEKDW